MCTIVFANVIQLQLKIDVQAKKKKLISIEFLQIMFLFIGAKKNCLKYNSG